MIVLIAIQEKTVVITDNLATAPISGRQSIFARVNPANTEQRLDVEIVGVYSNLEITAQARSAHAASHPGRRDHQKVAHLDDHLPAPPEPARCVYCGTETGGLSYCPSCQQEHWRRQREQDPDFPKEAEPPVPTTVSQHTQFVRT